MNGISKRLLIAAPRNLSGTTKMLIQEAKRNFDVVYAPLYDISLRISGSRPHILHNGKEISDIDYFLPRIDSFRAYHGYQIVNAFDFYPRVLKPYPAWTVNAVHDKFLTTAALAKKKIPVPETYLLKTKKDASLLAEKIGFPVMMKLMSGSGGVGVMYVENREQMASLIESMSLLKQEVLVQEYVSSKKNAEDLRLMVAGDQVIGAMKRIAPSGEKRANIKLGGRGVRYLPSLEIAEIALKSSEAVEAKICAVDIIESKDGPKVIEVNINPGIQGLMKATGVNIAKKIVEYIAGEVSAR